jgi:hypothetical protein
MYILNVEQIDILNVNGLLMIIKIEEKLGLFLNYIIQGC